MKNQIARSVLSALLAATAVCIAAAVLLLWIMPFFDSILADNRQAVKPVRIKKTIILDAGHGGEDPGAIGTVGTLEKDLNLSLALIMRDYLVLNGCNVVMTREDDVMLYNENDKRPKKSQDLSNRLRYAEEYPNAIFVSIHMNKFPVEKYSGLQVYYSKNNSESSSLATMVKEKIHSTLQKSNTREIKPATSSIFILDRITIPAVLIECGFLSNTTEEALLRDELYRKQLALALTSAIDEYLDGDSAVENNT